MDLIIYWRFESPGRISDLMLYFHLSHCPYKCTPLNPRYAPKMRTIKEKEVDLSEDHNFAEVYQ